MPGLNDGLGFEEVNKETTSTEIISGANVYGGTQVKSAVVSGTSIRGETMIDADGTLTSSNVNASASVAYGATVQAGSIATSAGSAATVLFGQNFAGSYFMTLSPQNFVAGVGSVSAFSSGTRNVSGCEIVGAASTTYDWVAVGL